jgi:hypothetical protein
MQEDLNIHGNKEVSKYSAYGNFLSTPYVYNLLHAWVCVVYGYSWAPKTWNVDLSASSST